MGLTINHRVKKDGSVRLCGDYRRLNSITEADSYYLPRIEELLFKIAQAKFITTIDLCKGFYQISMAQCDKEKTAFISPLGKYHFTRMPFGLKNAPSTFQRLMDDLFQDQEEFVAVYIDDLAVYSTDIILHMNQ